MALTLRSNAEHKPHKVSLRTAASRSSCGSRSCVQCAAAERSSMEAVSLWLMA